MICKEFYTFGTKFNGCCVYLCCNHSANYAYKVCKVSMTHQDNLYFII